MFPVGLGGQPRVGGSMAAETNSPCVLWRSYCKGIYRAHWRCSINAEAFAGTTEPALIPGCLPLMIPGTQKVLIQPGLEMKSPSMCHAKERWGGNCTLKGLQLASNLTHME